MSGGRRSPGGEHRRAFSRYMAKVGIPRPTQSRAVTQARRPFRYSSFLPFNHGFPSFSFSPFITKIEIKTNELISIATKFAISEVELDVVICEHPKLHNCIHQTSRSSRSRNYSAPVCSGPGVIRLRPYFLSGYPLHLGCGSAGPGVELVDEQAGELVLGTQRQGAFKVLLRLRGKTADDVCADGHARYSGTQSTYLEIQRVMKHIRSQTVPCGLCCNS